MKKMLKRDQTRYKLFLKMLIEQSNVSKDEQVRVNKIHQQVFGGPIPKITSCASCLKKRVMDCFKELQTPEEKSEALKRSQKNKRKIQKMKEKRLEEFRKQQKNFRS